MRTSGEKGIDSFTPYMSRSIWRAYNYLSNERAAPNQNTTHAIQNAKREISEAIELINTFFEKDWAKYQENVEAVEDKTSEDK